MFLSAAQGRARPRGGGRRSWQSEYLKCAGMFAVQQQSSWCKLHTAELSPSTSRTRQGDQLHEAHLSLPRQRQGLPGRAAGCVCAPARSLMVSAFAVSRAGRCLMLLTACLTAAALASQDALWRLQQCSRLARLLQVQLIVGLTSVS